MISIKIDVDGISYQELTIFFEHLKMFQEKDFGQKGLFGKDSIYSLKHEVACLLNALFLSFRNMSGLLSVPISFFSPHKSYLENTKWILN
jgi:hypothetical protein